MRKTVLLAALLAALAHAQAAEPYVGLYRQGSVDTIFQLAVLPKGKFCLAGTAGALDLMVSGSYQARRHGKNYQLVLKQKNFPASPFKVFASPLPLNEWLEEKTDAKRALLIHMPAISYQTGTHTPVGFGADKAFPENFKALVSEDASSLPARMQIALPENARYLFIGHPAGNKLYRFDIGTSRVVVLSAATHTGRRRFEAQAIADGQTLEIISTYGGHEVWGNKSAISAPMQAKIERYCFAEEAPGQSSRGYTVQAQEVGQLSDYWQPRSNQVQWLEKTPQASQ